LLDFDNAITNHLAWKQRLLDYLQTRDGSIRPEHVEPDHICALGQWLYGDAMRQHAHHASYARLVKTHHEFHQSAGAVVRAIHAGATPDTPRFIAAFTQMNITSQAVIDAISGLSRAIE
jgi:hypothetical protein